MSKLNLNNLSPEIIQNALFPYLRAFERVQLEQTNKRFRDLSRNYLSEDLKRDFGIERVKLNKFYSTNPQEDIRSLYIHLYRCSKILSASEMEMMIKAINEKNEGPIEEAMIICQEIKLKKLKEKIRDDIFFFLIKLRNY